MYIFFYTNVTHKNKPWPSKIWSTRNIYVMKPNQHDEPCVKYAGTEQTTKDF